MKKVLIYETKHADTMVWDVSTPQLRELALLELFREFDKSSFYTDLPAEHFQFYNMAKRGNATYAEALLALRKKYEYEGFREVPVLSGGVRDAGMGVTKAARPVASGDLERAS